MKRILTIFILALSLAPLRAQVATVEVSRPYDVKLDDIRKPPIPVMVDDSLHRFDVHFDYSIFNRPYSDLYDFTPYESIQLSTVGANRTPFVHTRLGGRYAPGENGLMPAAELYIQSRPRNGFCSGLYGRHNSFFGDLGLGFDASPVLRTMKMENTVGGGITYDWSTGEMLFDVQYVFDRYKYLPWEKSEGTGKYSSRFSPMADHRNNSLKASLNLNSAQKEANTLYYDITLAYRNTVKNFQLDSLLSPIGGKRSIGENMFTVNGYVGATFDTHRVYVDMNIEYASYGGARDFSIGVVEFSPFYQYNRKRLSARLGVKFGSRYGTAGELPLGDLDLSPRSSIFPDIDLRYTIVSNALWVHAVLTGGNDLNAFSRMVDDCPIINPMTPMEFGKRPIDATLSFEGVVSGRLGLNLESNFKNYRNKMFFVPVDDGTSLHQMSASYRDVNQFSVQGEVFWKSQDLALGGRLRYARYTDTENKARLTEMPVWTGYAFVRYNLRERLITQLECNYRSSTGGNMIDGTGIVRPVPSAYEVPAIVDMDLNMNYLINKHLAVYLKVGNLLGRRNQYMPLYLEPGINFGAGVSLNF